jgi:diguanylate cyclase (GGDEF)-like protein/PAS domain S-box-containing protein
MGGVDTQAWSALAALPLPVLLLHADGQVIAVNPACAERFAIGAECWPGRPLDQHLSIPGLASLLAVAGAGEAVDCETRLHCASLPQHVTFAMQLALRRLPDGDGRLLLSLQDLTRERHLERMLIDAQARAGVGSWHVDIHTGRSQLTPEAYRLYGLREDETIDLPRFMDCIHPEDREHLLTCWKRALRGAPYALEHRVVVEGEVRWIEVRGLLETDAQGRPVRMVGSALDITRHKQAEESIRQLVHYDPLTRLPNRNMARMELERLLQSGPSSAGIGVLMLDLDRFKELNDAAGHLAGDEALVWIAATVLPLLRSEAMLARVGGDGFMVILPDTGIEDAIALAGCILTALEQPLELGGRPHYVRASIGIAVSPEDGTAPAELVQHAETAMYEAKSAGGQRYGLYRRQMSNLLRRRIGLATRLDSAVRDGRLALHYQPKVELASGRLVGAEALARWHDAELGWVSPTEFIPLAEERGLIGLLGEWALAQAASDHRRWSRGGALSWKVAVNVSAHQLVQGDFAERAEAVVRQAGAQPHDIELELTETAIASNPQLACATADRLAAAGFALTLDDFGTGYSSLAQLHRFRVQKLKIDLEFIHGMARHPGHQAIVRAVVGMARALGLVVVAEGIETREQAECLEAFGCDEGQGWFYGEAVPAAEFARTWLPHADEPA